MNICYLKFINFSLGAGGMVRQNLQWNNSNDTFSHSAYLRQFSPVRMSTAAFENIPRERAASVRPDSVAMFSSFPERNTSLRPPPSLYLITRTLMFIQRCQKQCLRVSAHPRASPAPCISHLETLTVPTDWHLNASRRNHGTQRKDFCTPQHREGADFF